MADRRSPPNPQDLLDQVGWVHDLARSVVLDSQAAADVAQDALVAALESPPKALTNEPAGLRAWLSTVLRNIARTHHRADIRRRRREVKVARGERAPSMSEMLERAELHRALVSAVLTLREPYRSVVLLRFFEGFSPAEIAAERGVSAATARSQLKRGLELLRDRFDREFGDRNAWLCPMLALAAHAPPIAPIAVTAAAATSTAAPLTTISASMPSTVIAAKSLLVGGVLMSVKTVVTAVIAGTVLTAGAIFYLPKGAEAPRAKSAAPSEVASAPLPPPVVGAAVEPMYSAPAASSATDAVISAPTSPPVATSAASIEGIVTDKNGKALADIVLHAVESHSSVFTKLGDLAFEDVDFGSKLPALDDATRRAESDHRGTYRIAELAPGSYQLVARGLSYQPRVTRGLELGPNSRLTVDVKMEEGAFVEGIVLDSRGRPVAGAEVSTLGSSFSFGEGSARIAILSGSPGDDVLRGMNVRTGRDGRFRIEGLPLKPTTLEARHDDFAAGRREGVAPNSRDVELRLADGGRVLGVVLDPEGKGIVGATVRSFMGASDASVTTDAEGRFVLEHLEPGSVQFEAHADGFPRKRSARLTIADGEEVAGIEIVLEEGATVSGLVLDPDGQPLEGARLSFKRGEMMMLMSSDTRTDGAGRFTLKGLRRGFEHTARVTHPRYLKQEIDAFTTDQPEIDLGSVTLRRGAELSGKVVDTAGAPVVGAPVSVETARHEGGQVELDAVEMAFGLGSDMIVASGIAGPGGFVGGKSSAKTDANGHFTLTPLEAGEYSIKIRMAGFAPLESDILALSEGQRIGDLVYTLGHGSEIQGVVVNARSEPIAGAHVEAMEESSEAIPGFDPHGRHTNATTDADGRFRLAGLDAGSYRVTSKFGELAPAVAPGVAAGEAALKLVLLEQGSVVGVVYDAATRAPVTQFSIQLDAASSGRGGAFPPLPPGLDMSLGDFAGSAQESADGSFTKSHVNPGAYLMSVSAASYVSAEVPLQVEPGRETRVDVLLEHGGAIEGVVVDKDGKPIAGAIVERVAERKTRSMSIQIAAFVGDEGGDSLITQTLSGGPGQVATDAEGKFLVSGLPPGKIKLRIEHDNYMSHVTDETVVIKDQTVRIDKVTLAMGGTIRGTVFRADGTPLKRGNVMIERQVEGDASRDIPKLSTVDADGRYQQTGLERGTYRLSAHAFDGGAGMFVGASDNPSTRTIELGQDAEVVCDLRLE